MSVKDTASDDPRHEAPDHHCGERALLLQAFWLLLDDLYNPVTPEDQRVEAWYWYDSDSRQPGGFRWYCDLLDLDADAVRYGVRKRISGKSMQQRMHETPARVTSIHREWRSRRERRDHL